MSRYGKSDPIPFYKAWLRSSDTFWKQFDSGYSEFTTTQHPRPLNVLLNGSRSRRWVSSFFFQISMKFKEDRQFWEVAKTGDTLAIYWPVFMTKIWKHPNWCGAAYNLMGQSYGIFSSKLFRRWSVSAWNLSHLIV